MCIAAWTSLCSLLPTSSQSTSVDNSLAINENQPVNNKSCHNSIEKQITFYENLKSATASDRILQLQEKEVLVKGTHNGKFPQTTPMPSLPLWPESFWWKSFHHMVGIYNTDTQSTPPILRNPWCLREKDWKYGTAPLQFLGLRTGRCQQLLWFHQTHPCMSTSSPDRNSHMTMVKDLCVNLHCWTEVVQNSGNQSSPHTWKRHF